MGYTRAPQNQDMSARHNRLKQRKRKADDVAAAPALLELQQTGKRNTHGLEEPPLTQDMGTATQTSLSSNDITALEKRTDHLERDNMALRSELSDIKAQRKSSSLDENDFKGDNSKLKFYTGLPCWGTFLDLFNLIASTLPSSGKLSQFNRVLLFLMKM